MDWELVLKVVVGIVLAVVAGGVIFLIEDSLRSYPKDPGGY